MATPHRQIGEAERVAIRRRYVMQKRVEGHTYEQIMNAWNTENPDQVVGYTTITKDGRESLRKAVEDNRATSQEYRQLMIERLEQMLRAPAFQEKINKGNLLAIDRGIKIIERMSKLYGADMPSKIAYTDVTGEKDVGKLTDEERAKRIQEIMEEAAERKREAEMQEAILNHQSNSPALSA